MGALDYNTFKFTREALDVRAMAMPPGHPSALSVSSSKSVLVCGFATGARGAHRSKTAVLRPGVGGQILAAHPAGAPLFVYLAYQNVHGPTQVRGAKF